MRYIENLVLYILRAFPERRFIVSSHGATRFIYLRSWHQFFIFCIFLTTVLMLSVKCFQYYKTQSSDISAENKKLKDVNNALSSYVHELSEEVDLFNNYFNKTDVTKKKKNIKSKIDNLEKFENTVNDVKRKKDSLYSNLDARLHKVKNIFVAVGMHNNRKLFQSTYATDCKSDCQAALGGPFIKLAKFHKVPFYLPSKLSNGNLDLTLNKLSKMENIVLAMPLGSPIKTNYTISSHYGIRIDPFNKVKAAHYGIDLYSSEKNTNIVSVAKGKVLFAGRKGAYGNCVEIIHSSVNEDNNPSSQFITRYGHLDKIYVRKGQEVGENENIGSQGKTGRASGAHLHYEIRYKGVALDPLKFIVFNQEVI
jgi:murein DD-endopeptidase MepM/ murein hydrolase activator NlpD